MVGSLRKLINHIGQVYNGKMLIYHLSMDDEWQHIMPGTTQLSSALTSFLHNTKPETQQQFQSKFSDLCKNLFILGWRFAAGIEITKVVCNDLLFSLKSSIQSSIHKPGYSDKEIKKIEQQQFPITIKAIELIKRNMDSVVYCCVKRIVERIKVNILIVLVYVMLVEFNQNSGDELDLDQFYDEITSILLSMQKKTTDEDRKTVINQMLKISTGKGKNEKENVVETVQSITNAVAKRLEKIRKKKPIPTTNYFFGGTTVCAAETTMDLTKVHTHATFTDLIRGSRDVEYSDESDIDYDTDTELLNISDEYDTDDGLEKEEGLKSTINWEISESDYSFLRHEVETAQIQSPIVNLILNQKKVLRY
jgi:hypothetical protein